MSKEDKDNSNKKDRISKIIMLIIIIILLILLCLKSCNKNDGFGINIPINGKLPDEWKPEDDLTIEDSNLWDGTNKTVFSKMANESIDFPGFTRIVVNEDNKKINLFNYETNTVLFRYVITKSTKLRNVSEFKDSDDATIYVNNNSVSYSYVTDEDGNCKYKLKDGSIVDSITQYSIVNQDSKYIVYAEDLELCYYTNAIEPGHAVEWNVYDTFGTGSYNITMRIMTYDINTHVRCNDSVSNVSVTVQ